MALIQVKVKQVICFKVDLGKGSFYCQIMLKYIILAIGMLSLLMVGCGEEKQEKITITWWHFWTDANIKPVIQGIIKDFEAQNPGITIDLVDLTWADGHDKIAIAFSSGSGPDIVELGSDWVSEFSTTGHLCDITDRVDSIKSRYLMWGPAGWQDKIYAFPWVLGTRVLFTNTDLLTRAGYDADFIPHTWPEFYNACRKMNQIDGSTFGFGSNSAERHRLYKKFLPFLWANRGEILSSDQKSCRLNTPAAHEALEFYLRLCETGLTDTQRRLEDAFLEGRIGFIISGDWLLKRIEREKADINFNTMLIPGPDGPVSSRSFAGGEYLAINNECQHKNEALALIRHISSPSNQLRFCLANRTANPSSKVAAADTNFLSQPHFNTFIRQMQTAQMPPVHPRWVYIEAIIETAIEKALYDAKPIATILDEACREIEEILNE